MDPALLLTKQKGNRALLDQLKNIWLTSLAKPRESQTTPVSRDKVLELKGIVGRFATCTRGFQEELAALKQTVITYVNREHPARPLNVLIAANPGSGKSFLVKELSKEIMEDTEFLEYHVASFREIGDLFSIFQRIQSLNLEGKLPFVLLDEVDGRVDGKYIFPNLLAPLWDGVFHIGQERHHLGRAVLFFAASALMTPPSVSKVLGSSNSKVPYVEFAEKWRRMVKAELPGSEIEKAIDFIDRIDLLLCIPPIDFSISDSDPLQEYQVLACLLVKKHFPLVSRIEKSVAWVLILELLNSGSRRRAESVVFRSKDPSEPKFTFENLPSDIREMFKNDDVVRIARGVFFDFRT